MYGRINWVFDFDVNRITSYNVCYTKLLRIRKGGITVVFDGKKEPSLEVRSEKVGSIDVYYSLDYSADYLIKQFIKKDMNPKMITSYNFV